MKFAKSISKYIRISPRKARLAAGLIRGLDVNSAFEQLHFSKLKSGRLLFKTLKSAVSNAETIHEGKKENMKVFEVRVDEGPTMKRVKSRNRGGRSPILKRMSHLSIIVSVE
jgi:large subunit ribosomal protein L22